jgi:hypothetical protein
VYTKRRLALRDNGGRINRHGGKRSGAEGKRKRQGRKASGQAGESENGIPGKEGKTRPGGKGSDPAYRAALNFRGILRGIMKIMKKYNQ